MYLYTYARESDCEGSSAHTVGHHYVPSAALSTSHGAARYLNHRRGMDPSPPPIDGLQPIQSPGTPVCCGGHIQSARMDHSPVRGI